jgi:pimeloyl-ACP methyl ester carboxylesterase
MLDLPGHGLSGRPEAPYDLDWHADMVGEWIDFMGFDEVDIVGHSFGGGVAQYLLLTHAEKVRRLGLVAPGGLGQEVALGLRLLSLPGAEAIVRPFLSIGVRIAYARLAAGAFPDDDRDWLARVSRTPGSARALTKTVRGVINLRGQHRQVLDHIGEVEQLPPVALFWGERDNVLPIAHAERAMAYLDDIEITRFACGHHPHLEVPGRFSGALMSFLDRA